MPPKPPPRGALRPLLLLPLLLGSGPILAQEAAPPESSPALADYDGDGRLDLALLDDQGNLRLVRNEGATLRDVTAEVGLSGLAPARLAQWQDFDRDGEPDLLVVGVDGSLRLLRAAGGVFEPAAEELADLGDVADAEWLDLDRDGWSDLWIRRASGWALLRNRAGRGFEPLGATLLALAPLPSAVLPPGSEAGPQTSDGPPSPSSASGPRASAGTSTPRAANRPEGSAAALAGASANAPLPPPSASLPATFTAPCARTLFDVATAACLSASSVPSLGRLYPLSVFLNVDATGRVGIGTTSPTHRLTVQAPNDDALRLIGAGTFGSEARVNLGDGDFVYLYEDVDDSLEIHASGRTALTGGNVGIGTMGPVWPLHVVSATQAVGRFDSGNATNGSAIELRNNSASPARLGELNFVDAASLIRAQIACTGAQALTFRAGNAERMRIDGVTGRIGIGTATPGFALDVRGAAQVFNPLMMVEETGGGALTSALEGRTSTSGATGVTGFNLSTSAGTGVSGISNGSTGKGVWGTHAGGGVGYGVQGSTQSGSGYGVFSSGNFGGTGAKYFVQPHPADPAQEIRFVCLEGNESGTYFRGSAELRGGRATIDVPQEFRLVSEADGLTVQVTPRGRPVALAVESVDLGRIVVVGTGDVRFDYFVNGVRRGFAGLECLRENHAFVPETRGEPFGAQYPPALRSILVENGILNADFTPNEATAARLGWTLADPSPAPSRTGAIR